jgi:hypothetical protein
MRRLATMCAVLALGCDATRVFEVPAEVTYAALIEPGSRSPLLPIAEATTALASELSAVTLLGFSSAQLGPPALSIDQTEPLSLDQRPCGLLPRASGARRALDLRRLPGAGALVRELPVQPAHLLGAADGARALRLVDPLR